MFSKSLQLLFSTRLTRISSQPPTKEAKVANACETIDAETVRKIEKLFRCQSEEATELYRRLNLEHPLHDYVFEKLKWLRAREATLPVILNNCNLMLVPLDSIKRIYKLLKGVQWKKTDDFIPLLAIDEETVLKIKNHDVSRFSNRLYELSEWSQLEPHIMSKACARHPYIFDVRPNTFKEKFDIIRGSIHPQAMLHDMDLFRHSKNQLLKRLEFLKSNGFERILPWMIKCSDKTLNRTIELRMERSASQIQISDCLSARLKWHGLTAVKMFKRNKFLHTLDLNEVEPVLDFVLSKLTPAQITANIWLLRIELEALKKGFDEFVKFNKEGFKRILKRQEKEIEDKNAPKS